MSLTIGITTFEHRFEKYFKPLLRILKEEEPDIEVIVAINGEYKEKFNQSYRKEIMLFCANYDNVFPIFYPQFRGLSKLWNNIIIHSSNENIILLNDDVSVDLFFLQTLKQCIKGHDTSFKINKSWSHVHLKKTEVIKTGFFDERLLGIGEEDGDFEWRYCKMFNTPSFKEILINNIFNHRDMSHTPTNTKPILNGDKYSLYNQETMYTKMYAKDDGGEQRGECPFKLKINEPLKTLYPYELYYLENKNKL